MLRQLGEVGTHDMVLMFTSDLHLMPVRAASRSDRERVHFCLRARMIKRFPHCCFAREDVPFTFTDNTRGSVGMVSSYVGMMQGRPRFDRFHFTNVITMIDSIDSILRGVDDMRIFQGSPGRIPHGSPWDTSQHTC